MSAEADAGLVLGVNLQGFGQRPAAWRTQDVEPTDLLSAEFWGDLGRIAERGLLDMVFFADHPALGDPNVRAYGLLEPFVALGRSPTRPPTSGSSEPRRRPTTTRGPRRAAAVARHGLRGPGGVERGDDLRPVGVGELRRRDEPGATRAVRPCRGGRRPRPGALAVRRHRGPGGPPRRVHRVRGTISVPPSAQGHPVVFQAGGSPHGRDLAARVAEGVFAVELTPEPAREHYRAVKQAAETYGRRAADVAIVPGLSLVLGSTEAEAQRRFDELEALAPDGYSLRALGTHLDADLTDLDPDAPIPAAILDREVDPVTYGPSLGYHETVVRWVRSHNTSLREVLRGFGGYGAGSWSAPPAGRRHHRGVVPHRGRRRVQPDGRRVPAGPGDRGRRARADPAAPRGVPPRVRGRHVARAARRAGARGVARGGAASRGAGVAPALQCARFRARWDRLGLAHCAEPRTVRRPRTVRATAAWRRVAAPPRASRPQCARSRARCEPRGPAHCAEPRTVRRLRTVRGRRGARRAGA
ncbi:LLM class flavin-dependent oxidoreductase [Curtobacterium flaccumfaciens]|nr:LLM class flavin-dependent oxidoreductase [Curtobacterium flaccumfaciens]